MGVYKNENGVLTPIANETQFIAPVNEYVTKPELEAIVPSDTSADNKLVNDADVADYFEEHKSEFKGDKGDTGATPNIAATAEVGATVGTPSVSVTKTGTAENPALHFNFQNLKGVKGDKGDTGNTGSKGDTGATGNGIASIEKTATSGLVDTYTITFTNGNTTTFTVSNGLGIKSADINANGHLIITYSDDTTYDAGALSDIYATTADVDAKINDVWKAQGELGAKNLLPFPYSDSEITRYGVIFTSNEDGSISINGTPTNTYTHMEIISVGKGCYLPAGEYILSDGLPQNSTAHIIVRYAPIDNLTQYTTLATTTRNDRVPRFTITDELEAAIKNNEVKLAVRLFVGQVAGSYTEIDEVAYPMIRLASDTDSTYQPFAMTNKALTDGLNWLIEQFDAIPIDAGTGTNSVIEGNVQNNIASGANSHAEGLAKFGKKLWQGNFTSGSIEVEGAAKYTMFVFMLDAVACIGTIAMGGTTIMKPQATYDYQYLLYRCNTNISGDNVVLTINTSNKGGALITSTGGASQRAITAIYGLF